jgi:hypothetical protein
MPAPLHVGSKLKSIRYDITFLIIIFSFLLCFIGNLFMYLSFVHMWEYKNNKQKICNVKICTGITNSWFSRDVMAAMLVSHEQNISY